MPVTRRRAIIQLLLWPIIAAIVASAALGASAALAAPASAPSLAMLKATPWSAWPVSLNASDDALPDHLTGALQFRDGSFGGSTTCNTMRGTYTYDPASGAINMAVTVVTRRACHGSARRRIETALLQAIRGVVRAKTTTTGVELVNADGVTVLVLTARPN